MNMERINVYLGLGSNLGNREMNLLKAMNLLDYALGTHPERISRIVESPAWGFEGPAFLNMCVMYRLPRQGTPVEHSLFVLQKIKEIEESMGRSLDEPLYDAEGRRVYHDRIIDIDILLYGTHIIDTETLTIPHPCAAERDFVKKPLLEISKPDVREAFPQIFG